MSSHHIVRDMQEPALLIHRLDRFPLSILESLLEWSPIVMSFEEVIERYSKLGYKLDVGVVGFQNYFFWQEKLKAQQPITLLTVQGHNFMGKLFEWLLANGQKNANIITDDESFPEILKCILQRISDLNFVVYTETKRSVVCSSFVFKKWLVCNTLINVKPLTNDSIFTTSGLPVNLSDEMLTRETSLEMLHEGELTVECSRPPFLISEDI